MGTCCTTRDKSALSGDFSSRQQEHGGLNEI